MGWTHGQKERRMIRKETWRLQETRKNTAMVGELSEDRREKGTDGKKPTTGSDWKNNKIIRCGLPLVLCPAISAPTLSCFSRLLLIISKGWNCDYILTSFDEKNRLKMSQIKY